MISVVEGRVTHLLQGHTREVAELAAAGAGAPRLLLSLSRDGNLRLWDVPTETCLSSIQTDASCIVSGWGWEAWGAVRCGGWGGTLRVHQRWQRWTSRHSGTVA